MAKTQQSPDVSSTHGTLHHNLLLPIRLLLLSLPDVQASHLKRWLARAKGDLSSTLCAQTGALSFLPFRFQCTSQHLPVADTVLITAFFLPLLCAAKQPTPASQIGNLKKARLPSWAQETGIPVSISEQKGPYDIILEQHWLGTVMLLRYEPASIPLNTGQREGKGSSEVWGYPFLQLDSSILFLPLLGSEWIVESSFLFHFCFLPS